MDAFVKVMKWFNLQQKVMSITSDNGSNILKLTTEFEKYTCKHPNEWRPFDASKQHVPCLMHVINLAVQSMLGKGGLEAEAPDDMESMDIEDEDDSEGLICTSITRDEGMAPDTASGTALVEATETGDSNASTKNAL
ncbi:hypothetical protein BG005_003681, partial [Podila minutissima]